MSGSLVIVSGPSGSGKSSLCKEIVKEFDFTYLSISTTTREMRKGEVEGVDYFFVDRTAFESGIARGDFLEWAEVHGNFYGTSKAKVREALQAGKTVLFDIDVQGQESITRQFASYSTSVFVTTPTLDILKKRLVDRQTDSAEVIEKRIYNALSEMNFIDRYDYLLINDSFENSLEVLRSVVLASRYKQAKVELPKFITSWKS